MNKPIIFDISEQELEEIKNKFPITNIVDKYEQQLEDLFLIRNPKYKYDKDYQKDLEIFVKDHANGGSLDKCGKWIYFPWSQFLVHYLDDDILQEVRTARNKNFITKEEQEKFYNFRVGIAGLSVGSHGALTIAMMGGARKIKLADPDAISPSNLNRLRFDFTNIDQNKAELIAQCIYQLNPYSEITIYSEGINDENIEEFVSELDILVEELDDIEVKVKMRQEAKRKKIPVIMATDNGDNVIMDIERFDLHPEEKVFYGKLEGFDLSQIKYNPQKMYEAMARIIDVSLVPVRILHSVNEVGKSIYSWPQMATAATLSGSVLAYVVRKISLGEAVKEGKLEVSLDAVLDPDYVRNKIIREEEAEKFLKAMN